MQPDQNDIDRFQRDGVVCLRQQFDHRWLDTLSIGIERNFESPGPYSTVYTDKNNPGGFYDDYCNWSRIEQYEDFLINSNAASIAGQLMRSSSVRLYHEHVLIKEPGTREATPWHHDLPYYGVEGKQLCSIWLPLDPVPRHFCPEFIIGSHLPEHLYYPRFFLTSKDYARGIKGFESLPDIEAQKDALDIATWDLEPGDCIVFHMKTLHGAPPTEGLASRRRAFSMRWLGDDARFAKRAWKTSPPYPEVNLVEGDPMIHDCFPLLWQSSDPL